MARCYLAMRLYVCNMYDMYATWVYVTITLHSHYNTSIIYVGSKIHIHCIPQIMIIQTGINNWHIRLDIENINMVFQATSVVFDESCQLESVKVFFARYKCVHYLEQHVHALHVFQMSVFPHHWIVFVLNRKTSFLSHKQSQACMWQITKLILANLIHDFFFCLYWQMIASDD